MLLRCYLEIDKTSSGSQSGNQLHTHTFGSKKQDGSHNAELKASHSPVGDAQVGLHLL